MMELTSPAFLHNEKIPSKYTCDGANFSPLLRFEKIPQDSKSLVLICDDPDAPMGDWVHWLIWNIDPATTEIPENFSPTDAIQGTTSFGNIGYGGPCPPSGVHRYFFKLYALDTTLDLPPSTQKADLETAMENHILAQAEMIGLYQRQ